MDQVHGIFQNSQSDEIYRMFDQIHKFVAKTDSSKFTIGDVLEYLIDFSNSITLKSLLDDPTNSALQTALYNILQQNDLPKIFFYRFLSFAGATIQMTRSASNNPNTAVSYITQYSIKNIVPPTDITRASFDNIIRNVNMDMTKLKYYTPEVQKAAPYIINVQITKENLNRVIREQSGLNRVIQEGSRLSGANVDSFIKEHIDFTA